MPFSHFITGLDSTEPFHRIMQHVHVGDGEGVGRLMYMGKNVCAAIIHMR